MVNFKQERRLRAIEYSKLLVCSKGSADYEDWRFIFIVTRHVLRNLCKELKPYDPKKFLKPLPPFSYE